MMIMIHSVDDYDEDAIYIYMVWLSMNQFTAYYQIMILRWYVTTYIGGKIMLLIGETFVEVNEDYANECKWWWWC